MKGNIMDKKILLSGAAALLLVGNMYATPANASAISLSIGGEAKLTAGMSECGPGAAAATDGESLLEAITGDDLTDSDGNSAEYLAAVSSQVSTKPRDVNRCRAFIARWPQVTRWRLALGRILVEIYFDGEIATLVRVPQRTQREIISAIEGALCIRGPSAVF